MLLIDGQMVTNSRLFRVKSGSSQILLCHYLSSGRLHQWWPSKEHRSLLVHHHDLITHRWDICSSCCTTSQNYGNLRDALAGHPCLVVENSSKMLPVRKDIILFRQKSTS
jgi:hypothetical protein